MHLRCSRSICLNRTVFNAFKRILNKSKNDCYLCKIEAESIVIVMRLFHLLIIIALAFSAVANATTKPPQLRSRTVKKGVYTEHYKVLASDTTVRHGAYTLTYKGRPLEKGQYRKGQKAGTWEYYNLNDLVELRYDYDQQQPVYILPHFGYDYTPRNFPSIFLGSPVVLHQYVAMQTPYPTKESDNDTDCPVVVALQISATGKLTGCTVEKGEREAFNKAALEAIAKIPSDWRWIPARENGRNVPSTFHMTIVFEAVD